MGSHGPESLQQKGENQHGVWSPVQGRWVWGTSRSETRRPGPGARRALEGVCLAWSVFIAFSPAVSLLLQASLGLGSELQGPGTQTSSLSPSPYPGLQGKARIPPPIPPAFKVALDRRAWGGRRGDRRGAGEQLLK